MKHSASPSLDMPRADFGPPEIEFRPTSGQTAAGVIILGCCAAACFGYALFETQADAVQRFVMGSCGLTALGQTYWVYELRKWRLWICPGGVSQRRAWAFDEIAWSEVREAVVDRSYFARTADNVTLVRTGKERGVTVRPINCRHWKQAVEAVLKAANDWQIPVRTNVVLTD